MQLVPKEKAALARILLEDLDSSTDGEVKRLWIEEAERRLDAYLRGEIEARPGNEVMSRARDLMR